MNETEKKALQKYLDRLWDAAEMERTVKERIVEEWHRWVVESHPLAVELRAAKLRVESVKAELQAAYAVKQ